MWWLVLGCVIGGCRSLPASNPIVDPASPKSPKIPHADYDVVPAELGDADIFERARHRTVLRTWGAAWVREGELIGHESDGEANRLLAVLDETVNRLRVVIEDDNARFALWIDRADAATTVLAPIEVFDRAGKPTTHAGVWLEPGVTLDLGERAGELQRIDVHDPLVQSTGWLPSKLIGNVWFVVPGARSSMDMDPTDEATWSPADDHGAKILLNDGAVIRAARDPSAAILATTTQRGVKASLIATGGPWTEVEVDRPRVRIWGVVATASVRTISDPWMWSGKGTHGFMPSHADRIEIPSGTCLFGEADGEVAGVELATSVRYGVLRPFTGGQPRGAPTLPTWALVYVGSPWAMLHFYVHDVGDDSQQPVWESCAEAPHRR